MRVPSNVPWQLSEKCSRVADFYRQAEGCYKVTLAPEKGGDPHGGEDHR